MSKLQKCLYLIDLLERRGPMSLKEINEHYQYSSLYDSDLQPRTFLRYKDYILLNFPCYIEFNAETQKYYLIKNDYNLGNQSLYEYLLSAFHIEGMSELAIKHRNRIMLTDKPTGIENVQPILEAIDTNKGIEFDYWSFNKQTKKRLTAIPYFLRTWERRWYLVAEPDNHHHGQSVFALERMENIVLTEHEMKPSSEITVTEYFKGSFGINHSDDQHPVTTKTTKEGSVPIDSDKDPTVLQVIYPCVVESEAGFDYIEPIVKVEISCLSLSEPFAPRTIQSLICRATSGTDVPRDAHWLRHRRFYGRTDSTAICRCA